MHCVSMWTWCSSDYFAFMHMYALVSWKCIPVFGCHWKIKLTSFYIIPTEYLLQCCIPLARGQPSILLFEIFEFHLILGTLSPRYLSSPNKPIRASAHHDQDFDEINEKLRYVNVQGVVQSMRFWELLQTCPRACIWEFCSGCLKLSSQFLHEVSILYIHAL